MLGKQKEGGGTDEKFINTVIHYPFLYDKKEKLFKDSNVKNTTWHKIGQTFGITGDDAIKYFKGLREKYLRIKRKKAEYERSGAGAYFKENWHLFELLKFLDEVSRPRKTISNIMKTGNNSQMLDSEPNNNTPNTEDDTELIQLEFISDDISQEDLVEANVVSPLGADSASEINTTITHDSTHSVVDHTLVTPEHTPTVSRSNQLNKPLVKKGYKLEEKVSLALENIANSLKSPHDDYINTFCSQLEQEMMRMPPDMMEEFKDEVTELLLQKRKKIRSNRLNN